MDIGFIVLGNMGYPMARRMEEAEAMAIPMWVGNAVRQIFRLSTSEFGADKDFTTVVQCVERRAGVEVRAKKSG